MPNLPRSWRLHITEECHHVVGMRAHAVLAKQARKLGEEPTNCFRPID